MKNKNNNNLLSSQSKDRKRTSVFLPYSDKAVLDTFTTWFFGLKQVGPLKVLLLLFNGTKGHGIINVSEYAHVTVSKLTFVS